MLAFAFVPRMWRTLSLCFVCAGLFKFWPLSQCKFHNPGASFVFLKCGKTEISAESQGLCQPANPAYLTTQIPNCLLCSGQTLEHQLSCLLCLFRQTGVREAAFVLLGPSRLFCCHGQTQSLGLLNRRAFGCCFLLFVFVDNVLLSSPDWLGRWSPPASPSQMLCYKYGLPLLAQNWFSQIRIESYCWALWTWHWKQGTAFLGSFCSKWCCHSLPDVRGKQALSSVSIHHPAD